MSKTINPVSWFEIPVNDLDRAKAFYEAIFEIEMIISEIGSLKMAWFPWHEGGPGAAGTLVKADSYVPSRLGSMVYFSVDDIDLVLKKVESNGGKILNPKMSIGDYGFVGHFQDCEGNRVALHSNL